VESLVTQILMIFAVRTRRHIFARRPHRAVVGLAIGTTVLTFALPSFRGLGRWLEFVPPPAPYFAFGARWRVGLTALTISEYYRDEKHQNVLLISQSPAAPPLNAPRTNILSIKNLHVD
jgi:hypothetical protein